MVDNDDEVPGIAASPRHVRRARLHDLLDGVTGHRCVLVTGPAGAGKTELIRAWSAEQPAVTFHDLAEHGPAPVPEPTGTDGRVSIPVVLDNVHLANDPQLDTIIGLLAEPAGSAIVLAGRWMPPRLRAGLLPRSTVEVDESALALTEDETARLCAHYGRLPAEVLAEVFAVTAGWAAGAVIAATSMAGDPIGTQDHLHELHLIGATLHEYVVDDVLAHLSDDDRRAVADTSPVETVCAALFTALTGRPDAPHLLAELARDGMFAVPVGAHGWHRYRRLWRTALYLHTQQFDPARLRVLHRTASDWYAAHGRHHEAVHHATAAGEHARAAELAARYHFDLIVGGAQVVTIVPPPAPARADANPGSGRSARHVTPPPVVTGAAVQAATTAGATHDAGGPSAGQRVAELAEPAIIALRADRPREARAHLTAWLPAARNLGPLPHARALRHSAAAEMQLGNLQLAARQAAQARRILADHGVSGAHDDGWARIVLAGVHIQRHELTAAAEQLRGLAVDLWHADAPLTAAEYLHRAMIEQQRGNVRAALRTTHQLVQTEAPSPGTLYLHIRLLLANGYRGDAERYATRTGQLTEPLRRLIDANLLLAQGQAAHAAATLRPFLQPTGGATLHGIDALLLLADAAAYVGHLERATDLRRQAHRIAAPAGILRPFLLDKAGTTAAPRSESHPAAAPPPLAIAPAASLTGSEATILQLLDSLLTVAEIAEQLHLTENTVKTHISSIYRKLDVHRRRDAVQHARQRKLL